MRWLHVLPTIALALTCAACSEGDGGGQAAPSPRGSAGQEPGQERVTVQAGRAAPVTAEVADDDAERAVGLMRRTEVPPGTGMVFLYDEPRDARFYMYDVPVPLTAVFARDGEVVGVIDMPPCAESDPSLCPTYGPGVPFDTVLETAPATVEGQVAVGERLTVSR